MALVCFGCLVPNEWLPSLPNDKLMHFLAFAGLTLMLWPLASGVAFAVSVVALLAGGWAIECLQTLVPGRGFSWRDLAANAAGIAAACILLLAWQTWADDAYRIFVQ
ncbi:VanZ family protein [Pseudoduganella flava]|uniref:VanZ family protein n=1 Tax=Pseudoduganella flava TaxID=871742 RepID=UPI001E5CF1F7|nr:VanZ family protein [Pseudoduganella flava]